MERDDGSTRMRGWLRTGALLGALVAGTAIVPACFFPEFTFNDSTGGSTTSVAGGGSGGRTTSSTGGGGTTSSSSSSSSSTTMGGGGTGGTTTTSMMGGGGTGGMPGGGGTGGQTTSSSSSSSSTTTTTSTMPPVEDCTNGVDDDGDSLIDCKDTADCADYACVSSVPANWTGYYELYQGAPAGDPGCSEAYPDPAYVGNYNLNAPAANCNACLCGSPQGEVCNPPPVVTVMDTACNGTPTANLSLDLPGGWNGTCSSPVNMNGPYYLQGGFTICGPDGMQPCNQALTTAPPTVTGGFCASSGGGGMVPNAMWEGFARACQQSMPMGQGCNLSQKCMPKPKAPYSTLICIRRAGDFNCPAGQFSTKFVFYDDYTDSRACSPCSCGAPMGSTCEGNVSVYSDTFANSCTQLASTFPAGGCGNIAGNPPVGPTKFTQTMGPNGGTCSAIGGQPVGQATKTFPQTFCCLQTP